MWHFTCGRAVLTVIWWENLKDVEHLKDITLDRMIILKMNLKCDAKINLSQDKDKRSAVVSAVMNVFVA